MKIKEVPNEILLHIFQSAPTISTLHALSQTCKHFHSILSSHRLPLLYSAASIQYSPLHDATLISTYNSAQPAHLARPSPPQSLALLKRLVEIGKVANAWAQQYPLLKWRGELSAERRLLTSEEEYRLRRACYRIWLYALAFHTPYFPRGARHQPTTIRTRALLLRPWPSQHLAEILDLQSIFREVLHLHICPSNGTVLKRHKARYPDDPFPLVSTTSFKKQQSIKAAGGFNQTYFHSTPHTSRLANLTTRRNHMHQATTVEGWGDEITQYYVVEDMLKLPPGHLMQLYREVTGQAYEDFGGWYGGDGTIGGTVVVGAKGVVEDFVAALGDWFENNGETLCETIGFVLADRGGDLGLLKEGVEEGWEGIAKKDDE